MIEDEAYGTITRDDSEHATIVFRRRIPARVERVWAAITEPAELATWLAESAVDPRVGGVIEHVFDPTDQTQRVHGKILRFEPMTTLEYEWRFPGEPDSILRFDLASADDDTLLKLTHRLVGIAHASGYGTGWHAYLDALTAALTGLEQVDWGARFASVRGAYRLAD
jgi:uncharacterized protein YndB with AHSA1/START domain